MSSGAWIPVAAVAGFASSAIFSGALHWSRNRFILAWAVVVALVSLAFVRLTGINAGVQLRRRWRGGVVGGLAVGALLARSVLAQPASPAPTGMALGRALLWQGLAYGVADACLLSVLPVLSVYGSWVVPDGARLADRWQIAAGALAASLVVAAAYHLGFAEYRGAALWGPLIGNGVITFGYLLTGNPLAPVIAHILLHAAAVLHGAGTTVQLPPHY